MDDYYECLTCSYGTNSERKADQHLDDNPGHKMNWSEAVTETRTVDRGRYS